ncbi:KAP family P-loop NTPase fold protein [Thiorhodovibrio frisius]|uniref:KAP family P-loop domain protein n=1 Tax=Thiorhodovibrio frisius TaxID=631362 RepID=H8Z474_9GAMM|nr:KAP family P-loop domain protein [Thiorhodovibrio frisius]EIC20131.1 KAP family P-loop domain protein [Thiorhodovibrio frisius]WPL20865.1 putative P-loop ATPase [Thiorhodovibrio frisius]
MNTNFGVVDEPNPRGGQDDLGIGKHAQALTEFIKVAPTPMTIGIQGEWGSGKTSVLNTIYFELEQLGHVKQIWINSWESSLLSTPEESLIKIINEILSSLIECDVNKTRVERVKSLSSNVFRGALRVGANLALGDKASEITEELLGQQSSSIKQLRESLSAITNEIMTRDTNPFKKIVVYVDDLDRIEPKDAVRVLELLKNIFNVQGCIFVLAIDYQVVVKGLENKFGKRSEDNEWEFRAFFDKIIQLPFMMPLGQYNIGSYVGKLLRQVGFTLDKEINEDKINSIVRLSVGGNPRSLKRLINSLSLIMLFIQADVDDENENILQDGQLKAVLLALLCIQIAYPKIYDLLVKHPGFSDWSSDIAFEQTKGLEDIDSEQFNKDLELASKTQHFDEDWQKALFRVCYVTQSYRRKASEVSQLLNLIKNELLKDNEEQLETVIARIIEETSVTTVNTTDEISNYKPKFRKTNFGDWGAYSSSMLADIPADQVTDMKLVHDKFVEMFGSDLEIKYSPSFISFRKAHATGRQKIAFRLDPSKKQIDLFISLLQRSKLPNSPPAPDFFVKKYTSGSRIWWRYQVSIKNFDNQEFCTLLDGVFSSIT